MKILFSNIVFPGKTRFSHISNISNIVTFVMWFLELIAYTCGVISQLEWVAAMLRIKNFLATS